MNNEPDRGAGEAPDCCRFPYTRPRLVAGAERHALHRAAARAATYRARDPAFEHCAAGYLA